MRFSPCFTEFSPCFTKFRTCFTEFRTRLTLRIDQNDPQNRPPETSHMPHTYGDLQNPVSVIISCKTVKNDTVENTVRMGPRGVNEEPTPGAACCGVGGGIHDPFAACTEVCTSVTLRHFDHKVWCTGQNGPLIPCERRLTDMEISIFQEVTFETRFGYGDYDRPYAHFLMTLRRFD